MNGQTEEEMYRHYTQYATSIPSENANVKYLYCSSQHCQRRFFVGYIVVADVYYIIVMIQFIGKSIKILKPAPPM